MQELISIIVTSYNYDQFIPKTLESIIDQTHEAWEAIVIDDGSSDSSLSIIKEYEKRDSRIRLIQHPNGVNKGLSASIQLALSEARGAWSAFCESDDWWEPTFLEKLYQKTIDTPSSGLFFSDVILEGYSESMEKHCSIVRDHFRKNAVAIELYKLNLNAVPTFTCVLVKTQYVRRCNFESHFAPALDMWLWSQVIAMTQFSFIDKPLVHWRQHEQSYMKKSVSAGATTENSILEFKKNLRYNIAIAEIVHANEVYCSDSSIENLVNNNPVILAHLIQLLKSNESYLNFDIESNRLLLEAIYEKAILNACTDSSHVSKKVFDSIGRVIKAMKLYDTLRVEWGYTRRSSQIPWYFRPDGIVIYLRRNQVKTEFFKAYTKLRLVIKNHTC